MPIITPTKDASTITAEGQSTQTLIEGVVLKTLVTIPDERGEICEVYRPAWELHPEPLVYVYQIVIRPGKIKGWVVHEKQDDRLFFSFGAIRVVLFDNRPASPTYKCLNVFTFGERNRTLIVIPRGVFHALQNVGHTEAVFLNMPTRPYDHADPDKYRLPLKNDLIPFDFDSTLGW